MVKDDKKDTVKAVSPSGDAKPNEVQKKVTAIAACSMYTLY